jgi:hypothetical protein
MRTILGVAAGITLSILAYTIWQPAILWTLTRIPPATPAGWAPKHRTWHNGVLMEEP